MAAVVNAGMTGATHVPPWLSPVAPVHEGAAQAVFSFNETEEPARPAALSWREEDKEKSRQERFY
jgi:hypothetical protein